jgi:hypothetical protein
VTRQPDIPDIGVQATEVGVPGFRPACMFDGNNCKIVLSYVHDVTNERFPQDYYGVFMEFKDCTWGVSQVLEEVIMQFELHLLKAAYPVWRTKIKDMLRG